MGRAVNSVEKANGSIVFTGLGSTISREIEIHEDKLKDGHDGILGTSGGITIYKKDLWIVSTDFWLNHCDLGGYESRVSAIETVSDEGDGIDISYDIVTSNGFLYRCGPLPFDQSRIGMDKLKPL